jgi:hypothetical protein
MAWFLLAILVLRGFGLLVEGVGKNLVAERAAALIGAACFGACAGWLYFASGLFA